MKSILQNVVMLLLPGMGVQPGSGHMRANSGDGTHSRMADRWGWAHHPLWEAVRFCNGDSAWGLPAIKPQCKGDAVRH